MSITESWNLMVNGTSPKIGKIPPSTPFHTAFDFDNENEALPSNNLASTLVMAWSLWLPWSMATHGRDTSYLWQWLPISVDSGYLYFVTVATHIGYLFLLRSNIPQESFASTVSLYDGNAVIALHDKSGRLSDPTRPCSFAMTFNSTAERKDTLSHRPLKLIIPRLMSQTSSAAMARSQERISLSLNFLIDDKFLPFVIWHPVPV